MISYRRNGVNLGNVKKISRIFWFLSAIKILNAFLIWPRFFTSNNFENFTIFTFFLYYLWQIFFRSVFSTFWRTTWQYTINDGQIQFAEKELLGKNRKSVSFYRLFSPVIATVDESLIKVWIFCYFLNIKLWLSLYLWLILMRFQLECPLTLQSVPEKS